MTEGKRGIEGFTLVEVLLALAIVAVAFAFALNVFSGGLSRLGHDHNVQHALLVAQSQLARVGRDIALRDGEIVGPGSDEYAWRISIAPYGGGAGGLLGHRVVVSIGWTEGLHRREVHLDTVRLGLPGAAS
jgi:general secretion pathway protein I